MSVSKPLKLPKLSRATRVLSFDLESNGLHGEVFAVGAAVMTPTGEVVDYFSGRCEIIGDLDDWVKANVLPVIGDMSINYQDYRALREAFWQWYLQAEPQADYVLVSNGYPVEYRFLLKCQEENLDERYWLHPFPILDLTSILIGAGQNPTDKNQLVSRLASKHKLSRHHPLHDAKLTALTAFEVLNLN